VSHKLNCFFGVDYDIAVLVIFSNYSVVHSNPDSKPCAMLELIEKVGNPAVMYASFYFCLRCYFS
jgi:hypothetical protein